VKLICQKLYQRIINLKQTCRNVIYSNLAHRYAKQAGLQCPPLYSSYGLPQAVPLPMVPVATLPPRAPPPPRPKEPPEHQNSRQLVGRTVGVTASQPQATIKRSRTQDIGAADMDMDWNASIFGVDFGRSWWLTSLGSLRHRSSRSANWARLRNKPTHRHQEGCPCG